MFDPIEVLKPKNPVFDTEKNIIHADSIAIQQGDIRVEIEVRQIENGWIKTDRVVNTKSYETESSKETFTKERPNISIKP